MGVTVENRPGSDLKKVVVVFQTKEGGLEDIVKAVRYVAIRNTSYSTGNVYSIGCFASSLFRFASTKELDGGRQIRILLEGVLPHVGEAVLSVMPRGGPKRDETVRGILTELGVPQGVDNIIQTMAMRDVTLQSAYFPSKHRKWWV